MQAKVVGQIVAGQQAATAGGWQMAIQSKPTLKGAYIELRPADKNTIEYMFEKECDIEEKYLWSDSRDIPIMQVYEDEFIHRMRTFYHEFFSIYKLGEERPVGFIYSYQFNPHDKVAYATIYIEKENRLSFTAGEAGALFLNFLFTYHDLRKVYSLVYGYNSQSLSFLQSAGFAIEGEQKKHRYYNGEYHSLYTLALYREDFYERHHRLLERAVEGQKR